jgi:hypothetical protein
VKRMAVDRPMAIHTVDNLSRNTTGQPLEAK